jgi:ketosteroid isomerase-like protein
MNSQSSWDVRSTDSTTRRSLLAAGAGLGLFALVPAGSREGGSARQRRTQQVVRRLFAAIETRDPSTIWRMFTHRPTVDFPFLGLHITDFGTFDAVIGPLLANLDGLTFSDPAFVPLADADGVIAKYSGTATVLSTGKSYAQTYITEVHVDRDRVESYAEYFDTAALNAALTPVVADDWTCESVGRQRP